LDELIGQLGEPAEYAAGLRADAEAAQPGRLAGLAQAPPHSAAVHLGRRPGGTGPSPDATELHFRLDLCPKPLLVSPGNTQFIERIQLDYHALGRDRTAIVPLWQRIAVTVPARG